MWSVGNFHEQKRVQKKKKMHISGRISVKFPPYLREGLTDFKSDWGENSVRSWAFFQGGDDRFGRFHRLGVNHGKSSIPGSKLVLNPTNILFYPVPCTHDSRSISRRLGGISPTSAFPPPSETTLMKNFHEAKHEVSRN